MKKAFLLVGLLAVGWNHSQAQSKPQQNVTTCQKWTQADKKLNVLYRQILTLYASNPVFLKAFKASQVAWLKFRDAQEEALYPTQPGQSKQVTYGSVYTSCNCAVLTDLTTARNRQLQLWVDGIEEGDVCSGSVRRKP
ncbi:lysozyme inhibitor LprI family protein [Hymenobacter norwichensis]|uniref:lysozyme inhibitor LprI family protein n=1 Tax=Hymenobacter norwichensis TaxID=223903 RepID=UPI0003B5B1E6|nr:lysozyme inhibitor LprI family protein [Hymenobacter norwichensis]